MGTEDINVFQQGKVFLGSKNSKNSRKYRECQLRKTTKTIRRSSAASAVPAIATLALLVCVMLLVSAPTTTAEATGFNFPNPFQNLQNMSKPVFDGPNLQNMSKAAFDDPNLQPKNFTYTSLWVTSNGTTELQECELKNFRNEPYSFLPQFVKDNVGNPTKLLFVEVPIGFLQPPHNPPSAQFVISMTGHWFIQSTNGTKKELGPGEVVYQDNLGNSSTPHVPQHVSGVVGAAPCHQVIVQVDRTTRIGVPCPL